MLCCVLIVYLLEMKELLPHKRQWNCAYINLFIDVMSWSVIRTSYYSNCDPGAVPRDIDSGITFVLLGEALCKLIGGIKYDIVIIMNSCGGYIL